MRARQRSEDLRERDGRLVLVLLRVGPVHLDELERVETMLGDRRWRARVEEREFAHEHHATAVPDVQGSRARRLVDGNAAGQAPNAQRGRMSRCGVKQSLRPSKTRGLRAEVPTAHGTESDGKRGVASAGPGGRDKRTCQIARRVRAQPCIGVRAPARRGAYIVPERMSAQRGWENVRVRGCSVAQTQARARCAVSRVDGTGSVAGRSPSSNMAASASADGEHRHLSSSRTALLDSDG